MFPSCPVVISQGNASGVFRGKYSNLESCLLTGDEVTALDNSAMLAVNDVSVNILLIIAAPVSTREAIGGGVYIAGMAAMKAKKIN
jgi:hypothetical protein